MKFKLQAYSIWEFGQRVDSNGQPHQEDSIFPAFGKQTESDRLFVLCDGMGGHDAGEVASATVCEAMARSVKGSVADAEALFTDDMMKKAVDDAFAALDEHDSGAVKKMGTTMTFLKLHAGGATIAHMGDSRVYHIRPGKDASATQILFCTEDHSLVNDLVKVGELTPEEARVSPQKNIITRAMQPHMERRPKADVKHITDIRPGDYFYMCSDGMLEQMEDDNIRFNFSAMTGDDDNKVRVLTDATHYNRDNHTAFIIHILDVEGQPVAAEKPEPVVGGDDRFMVEAEDGDDKTSEEAASGKAVEEECTASDWKKSCGTVAADTLNHGITGSHGTTGSSHNTIGSSHGIERKSGLQKFLSNSKNLSLTGMIVVFVLALAFIFVPDFIKKNDKSDDGHDGTEIELPSSVRHNKPSKSPTKQSRKDCDAKIKPSGTSNNAAANNGSNAHDGQNGGPLKDEQANKPSTEGKHDIHADKPNAGGKDTKHESKHDSKDSRDNKDGKDNKNNHGGKDNSHANDGKPQGLVNL